MKVKVKSEVKCQIHHHHLHLTPPVVVFNVHLLAGEMTTAGDPSLALAVICVHERPALLQLQRALLHALSSAVQLQLQLTKQTLWSNRRC